MIKINLALKRQSALVTGSSAGSGLLGQISVSGLKSSPLSQLPIRRFVAPAVLYFVAAQMSEFYKQQLVDQVTAQITKQAQVVSGLESEAAKLKDYEKLKVGLETDQTTIRSKMGVISELLAERTSKLRLLAELSKATPDDVWLKSIEEVDRVITIIGSTERFNSIPDFLANLAEVKYLQNVKLVSSSKSVGAQQGKSGDQEKDTSSESLPVFEIQVHERLD